MTINFSTSNGTNVYNIIDSSTDTSSSSHKRVIVTSGIDNTILSDTGNIATSVNPVVLDTTSWGLIPSAIIQVALLYAVPGGAGDTLVKGYLAPKTLNLPL